MQASHSLFLLELGISSQPLQESYKKYSFLSTHSWMKMLWEKISMFGIRMIVADGGSYPPREGDRFLMQTFFEKGDAPPTESLTGGERIQRGVTWSDGHTPHLAERR